MNGLLDWGGSNYPGETFLSAAPRSRPRAQRAGLGWGGGGRGGEDPGGGGDSSTSLPAPPRGALEAPPPLTPPAVLRLGLRTPLGGGMRGGRTRSPEHQTTARISARFQKGLGEERGLNQGSLCCRVVFYFPRKRVVSCT